MFIVAVAPRAFSDGELDGDISSISNAAVCVHPLIVVRAPVT